MLFLDEYFDTWYVLVNCLIVISFGLTALAFIFMFICSEDTKARRKQLYQAYLLILIMWFLLSVWNIIYINELYRYDLVYFGVGSIAEEGSGPAPED